MSGINASLGVLFTSAEKSKLAGIEALADVTDATNVDAAGATMNTDLVTVATASSPIKTLASGLIDPTFIGNNYTKEISGFADRTSSAISWNDATPDRTFTITGTNFVVFSAGYKLLKSTETVQIGTDVGIYWIYYAATTYVLTATKTTPPAFDSGAILIATVYWNGTNGILGDERHGLAMDWNTHEYLHRTVGARYESGYTGTFTNTTLSITRGYFWDEDVKHDSLATITQVPVFYRVGSDWTWTALQNTVHYITGGNIQYDNAGTLTPATANNYVAYWVFATNNPTYPIISLMGQRQDLLIANARANNTYESLSFGTLPFAEMKVLYRVIVRNDATPYEETQDLRTVSNLPSGTYVATDHGVLTGLTDDDHTQYLLRSETNISNGRLCLATGAPDTIDQAASSTLYFSPYKGNSISLLVGGVNTVKTFTEQSIDFSAKTAAKPYDIFAYYDNTTDTVKIEELIWTNDTTRATALTLVNGVYYKNGDTTRKYLGTVYAYDDSGTTKIIDSVNYRYVDNFYNKIRKGIDAHNYSTWTYATNTYREWNAGTSMYRGNFVAGIIKSLSAAMEVNVRSQGGADDLYYYAGIALNSDSTPSTSTLSMSPRAITLGTLATVNSVIGLNYITGLEKTAAGTADLAMGYAKISTEIDC